MTEEEYRIAQQQASWKQLLEKDQAERIGEQAFIGTAYYPYDIDKPGNPPMKQANARVIEPPRLP